MRFLVAVLVLAVPLSGCVSEPVDEAPRQPDATAARPPDVAGFLPVVFAGPEAFRDEAWFNGSFGAGESAWPVGGVWTAATGEAPYHHTYDITDRIPPGVPVVLEAVVTATVQDAPWPQGGRVLLLVFTGAADGVYGTRLRQGGGYDSVRFLLQATGDDPVRVVVRYQLADPSPEVDYALHVVLTAQNALLPPAMHAALRLEAGDEVRLDSVDGPLNVTLWGPDDGLVAHLEEAAPFAFTVPAGGSGAYVVLNHDDGAPVRVLRRGEAGVLGLLPLEWVPGTEGQVFGPEAVAWESEVTRPVLRAGVMATGGEGAFVCGAFRARLVAADGSVVVDGENTETNCAGLPEVAGWDWFAASRIGDSSLQGGSFRADFEPEQAVNLVAQDWYRHYRRV